MSPTISGSTPVPTPRLSIVVLPFTNLSDDREQQYFADGITEDVTTDLSRLPDMFVISRNTAFTYRNKPVDTKQIGRELCVRYVLEGSARRSGSQVRINAQLIDAETDAHLWAERFDSDRGDLFALQNEITGRIAIALGIELIAAGLARLVRLCGRGVVATEQWTPRLVRHLVHAVMGDDAAIERWLAMKASQASRCACAISASSRRSPDRPIVGA